MNESASAPSSAPVTVLLASHSYSFVISSLSKEATVAELKRAIAEQCPGRPEATGQRIIVQGRVLPDEEAVPHSEPRTVHLAVHPAAWTATPPTSPRRANMTLPPIPTSFPMAPVANPLPSNEPPLPLTLQLSSLPTEFITHAHANALRILSGQPVVAWTGPSDIAHARRVARTVIKYAGLGWPPVLDEDLPSEYEIGKGLEYSSVVVDNLPYLALSSPDAAPTLAQSIALRVLTYTFPLLPLLKHLPRPPPLPSRSRLAQQQMNGAGGQVIRRFGINVRVGRGPARPPGGAEDPRILFDDENPQAYFPPVPEFRFHFALHLPPSRVLLQLLFTLSRAALLMYFFAPARQPLWAACIVGWIGWEIFVVLRHAGRERDRDGEGAGRRRADDGAPAPVDGPAVPNAGIGGAPAPGQNNAVAPAALGAERPDFVAALTRNQNVNELTRIVDRLANMNLLTESTALNLAIRRASRGAPPVAPGPGPGDEAATPINTGDEEETAAVEPSLVHRSTTFLALFVTSLVPAIWERRRARLREREIWVREMFLLGREGVPPSPTPEATVDGTVQPAAASGPEIAGRRVEFLNGWRKAYVNRVVSGEAGDDGE